VARNLDARVVVATLETQRRRFLERDGPALLVVDEYQLIGDPVRGINYELILALAPAKTQLLLLSGSVANPHDVVSWLRRIGRDAILIANHERPVPLEEVDTEALPDRCGRRASGYWSRIIGNAAYAGLTPTLVFAPRRRAAEQYAEAIAGSLPADEALTLSQEQEALAGPKLARLLKQRVAYHHSGLSYAVRAGIVEPLAKRGQLSVIVATMGLAAGINFSVRSVAVTETTYIAGGFERKVAPDDLLQMFGRAGRRGLDDIGYVLATARPPRLLDAAARQLHRAAQVDWPSLLAVMDEAAKRGESPFTAGIALNGRLFSPKEIPLGVERSRETGAMACGLHVDMERARLVRRGVMEMLASHGGWEAPPAAAAKAPLHSALHWDGARWRPALGEPAALPVSKIGTVARIEGGPARQYGREVVIGTRGKDGMFQIAPALRRFFPRAKVDAETLGRDVLGAVPKLAGGGSLVQVTPRGDQLVARIGYGDVEVAAWLDSAGRHLINPPMRETAPEHCEQCPELGWCRTVSIETTPAWVWRRLGLIAPDGRPTRRGVIFSFFHHGEGFAVAAALEDETYAISDIVFDLANLRAGPRFAGDNSPYGGRLGALCQQVYDRMDVPGYLSMGLPLEYGNGASEAVREMVEEGVAPQKLVTDTLRHGDLERGLVEWRSLLRQIQWAPDVEWNRWSELKAACARQLEGRNGGAVAAKLPELLPAQIRKRLGPVRGQSGISNPEREEGTFDLKYRPGKGGSAKPRY
jgi:hypothetical protein